MRPTDPPLLTWYLSHDQWREEHEALHDRLLELCRMMKWNPANYDYPDWETHHQAVREKFIPFMRDWRNHLSMERKTLYPVTKTAICGGRIGPVSVLEQDERIAGQFYEAYLEAAEGEASPEDALSRLLQVLMIVAEHFRVEEEVVVPAAERLMEEIEYSGS
ncbi:hemerythrin domain-containing protein [Cohnella sp. REN36]|uniref:hemerythrin domain-containing protein n=1 Tax=Cohnella sp. REN36 TaxID=2887347 RepID=UPI001D14E04D|nr:hemerythrin domain-containing protein [Cohnella sp. REN36]MCC3375958.1 hemerythrin domain-containing protein [Cohnella sp. REN36]